MGRKNLYKPIFGMKSVFIAKLQSVSDGSGSRFIHLSVSCDIIIRKIDFQRKYFLEIVLHRKSIAEKLQNTNGMMKNGICIHNFEKEKHKEPFYLEWEKSLSQYEKWQVE